MTTPQLPSGLAHGLPFTVPADWTTEQALAIFELLGDLRELVWSHYQLPLQNLIREQRQAFPPTGGTTPEDDDPPF